MIISDVFDLDKIAGTIEGVYKESKTELYININTGDFADRGIWAINNDIITSDTPAQGQVGHYYFPNDKVVKKVIVVTDSEGTTSPEWKTVSTYASMVQIENKTTETTTIIAGNAKGETIILDGTNKVITSDKSTTARIIGDDFNWEWPTLAMGTNSFEVIGNCDIKLEWIEPRKVGSL